VGSSFWLAAGHVDAETLFQSPVSPLIQSPVAQPPVEQPPIQQPPVEQAPVSQEPVAQPPVEQAPAQPLPTLAPSADQGGLPAAPKIPTAEPIRRDRDEEARLDESESGSPANFILDQAELIDTVVVSGAYIWLCCGVSLFLLVPLVLLFVHIRGRSKIIREEGY
jgi:hypothetical protein